MEDSTQLVFTYRAITVFVKEGEGDAQVFLVEQLGTIHGSCDELSIVYLAILVCVKLGDQLFPVLGTCAHQAQNLTHTFLQLLHRKEPILTGVQPQKHLLHVR